VLLHATSSPGGAICQVSVGNFYSTYSTLPKDGAAGIRFTRVVLTGMEIPRRAKALVQKRAGPSDGITEFVY
jgi:hypothetical protein